MESIYKSYDFDQLQEHFSQFIISNWSYSKVRTFARNQAVFEMTYLCNMFGKSSATTIAGQGYHKALQAYFIAKQEGRTIDLVELETVAFAEIDETPANKWKLQKTTPTVEECKEKAYKTVSALLRNFLSEKGTYEDDIAEVLAVELALEAWVTVNGVDIPLPCKSVIDLVVLTKEGKRAIVDHKSKQSFTDDAEIVLAVGKQAITYTLVYEASEGYTIDEVWFVENKFSQNKDKSAQLNKYVIPMDADTRALYEAKLYEPLKCMIEAVSDPDHVYYANDDDNFVDLAELNEFWARLQISEISDLNLEESKADLIRKRIKKIRDSNAASVSPSVIKKYQQNASKFIQYDMSSKDLTPADKIEHVLRSFGIQVQVAHQFNGYSSNTYLLEVGSGVKINSIFARRLEVANALNVANVRIAPELKVWEDKSYVAIDFAKKREGTLNFSRKAVTGRKIPIGADNYGNIIHWDLDNPNTPHIMICGGTGSGKSVVVRNIIECGSLMRFRRIIILDPKNEFPHLAGGNIEVYKDMEDIETEMQLLVEHMNNLASEGRQENILVVFDEFADAVLNSRKASVLKKLNLKTLEENMRALAQKGRSIGFRIVSAMQRADTKVITGTAKVNFPVRICLRVQSEVDSKVVLDEGGAEGLSGYGDGLMRSPEYQSTVRFQSYYIDVKAGIGETELEPA